MDGVMQRLEELREKAKISQTEAARIGGVVRGTYTTWINGREPSLYAVAKLADYYNVSIDFLVTGESSTMPSTSIPAGLLRGVIEAFDYMFKHDQEFCQTNYQLIKKAVASLEFKLESQT